jgi:hypothetical protein
VNALLSALLVVSVAGGAASARAAEEGFCEVRAEGAESFTQRFPSVRPGPKAVFAEKVAYQANSAMSTYWNKPGKRGSQQAGPLFFHCGDGKTLVTVTSVRGTDSEKAPFGPKQYKVLPFSSVKPGDFTVVAANLKGKPYHLSEKDAGTLKVIRFDAAAVEGTFSLVLVDDAAGRVSLSGSFLFPCSGTACK